MYGLPQACIIAYDQLVKILAHFSYALTRHTHHLWRYTMRPIFFSVCVHDFTIKYASRKHSEHLLAVLHTQYEFTTNWTGSTYLGITLKWDYINHTFDISMPGYIDAALHRFHHPIPNQQ